MLHAFLTMALHISECSAIKKMKKKIQAIDIKFFGSTEGKTGETELQIKFLKKLEFNIC
jgi:hypothetical protein